MVQVKNLEWTPIFPMNGAGKQIEEIRFLTSYSSDLIFRASFFAKSTNPESALLSSTLSR